jgi:hypothetical protein
MAVFSRSLQGWRSGIALAAKERMRRVVVVWWSLDAADDVRGGRWKRAGERWVSSQVGGGRGRVIVGPSLPNT